MHKKKIAPKNLSDKMQRGDYRSKDHEDVIDWQRLVKKETGVARAAKAAKVKPPSVEEVAAAFVNPPPGLRLGPQGDNVDSLRLALAQLKHRVDLIEQWVLTHTDRPLDAP